MKDEGAVSDEFSMLGPGCGFWFAPPWHTYRALVHRFMRSATGSLVLHSREVRTPTPTLLALIFPPHSTPLWPQLAGQRPIPVLPEPTRSGDVVLDSQPSPGLACPIELDLELERMCLHHLARAAAAMEWVPPPPQPSTTQSAVAGSVGGGTLVTVEEGVVRPDYWAPDKGERADEARGGDQGGNGAEGAPGV